MSQKEPVFIGIDVGTASVRAIAISPGTILASVDHPISKKSPQPDHFEQSSGEIWNACCLCVRRLLGKKLFDAESVKGIGFDATASLVVLDSDGN